MSSINKFRSFLLKASSRASFAVLAISIGLPLGSWLIAGRAHAESASQSRFEQSGSAKSAQSFRNQRVAGSELIEAWFELLSRTGNQHGIAESRVDEIRQSQLLIGPYLDEAFQAVRSSGQRYGKTNFVPIDIDQFKIRNISLSRPSSGVIVARYQVALTGATEPAQNLVMSDAWAPRLTVFKWNAKIKQWQVLSHANFNTPIAAICDSQPSIGIAAMPASDQGDDALARDLIKRLYAEVSIGKGQQLMHAQVQGQSASGRGWTTTAQFIPSKIVSVHPSDIKATRSGDYLVVSLNMQTEQSMYEGSIPMSGISRPRLLTYMRQPQLDWRLIAIAIFATPKDLPQGVQCIKPSR